ncbi:hypothetical protein [Shouchella shacheensis]|uniref:hypothetical protein n=1 Tax=Shouchella shacheensis TaxID=1649580 RepID=UPI00073FD348|nr:hypothetical protein [Shouchella shacheensis]
MKKKLLYSTMAGMMSVGVLAACGGEGEMDEPGEPTAPTEEDGGMDDEMYDDEMDDGEMDDDGDM